MEMDEQNNVGEFTVQEAADVLNVSHAYLLGLLDQGAISFRYTGEDRRILARDLYRYKQADDARRIACANELTAEAQKLNLGY